MRRDKTSGGATDLGGGAKVLYEDADMVVVDKPAGMISGKPDDQTGKTLFHLVKRYVGATPPPRPDRAHREAPAGAAGREMNQRAWIIHRLDRDVSGLLVFAKTHTAYLALKDQLQRRQVQRRYLAVVARQMPLTPAGQWKWIDAFLEDSGPGTRVRVAQPRQMETRRRRGAEAPERAITYYRVIAAAGGRSLLAVRLETGRKHQIRAHLAFEGHPILGDRLYGRGRESIGRLSLHAWELAFAHPATGQEMQFLAPPPAGFLDKVGSVHEVLQREAKEAAVAAAGAVVAPSAAMSPQRGKNVADRGAVAAPSAATSPQTGRHVAAKSAATAPSAKAPGAAPASAKAPSKGWDHVAGWYEDLISGHRSDYHEELIIPGVLRLLAPQKGRLVLDLACGEGMLCRKLAELGVHGVGIDASKRLIDAAARLSTPLPEYIRPLFITGDVRALEELGELAGRESSFDAAVSVLALMNMDPIEPVLRGAGRLLKIGGTFTAVIMHPAFRAPGQTSWGFEYPPGHLPKRERRKLGRKSAGPGEPAAQMHQYRRVEAYLSPMQREIVMNPGAAAHGQEAVTTLTFHRPLQAYIQAFAQAGLLVDALEEWPSHRQTDGGPFAAEHDRARREIPMFLALRGRRVK